MLRSGDALFGVGLVLLWIAGLATQTTLGLAWLDFAGALVAFYLAAFGQNRVGGSAGTIALAVVLIVASVAELFEHAVPWLGWSTFGLACLFLIDGIIGAVVRDDSRVPPRIVRSQRVDRR